MSEYLSVEDARPLPGMRLALTRGVPGPWGEAAKAILFVKKIDYARVAQDAGAPNEALFEWTGHANAPVAVYDRERPRAGWAEILLLAETVAADPPLLPAAADERALCFGLCHEICGEDGFGWNRRLMMLDAALGTLEDWRNQGDPQWVRLASRYGYSKAAAERAPQRCAEILAMLATRLERQHAAGSRYLLGSALSALDIYWATFAALVAPLPPELCPMPDFLRDVYTLDDATVAKALDPALLTHRDSIYEQHLELPLSF